MKKCLDYKRVLKGEEMEEPQNFLSQMISDFKKSQEERKAREEAKRIEDEKNSAVEALRIEEESKLESSPEPLLEQATHQRALSD